jgi:hypothetical protein
MVKIAANQNLNPDVARQINKMAHNLIERVREFDDQCEDHRITDREISRAVGIAPSIVQYMRNLIKEADGTLPAGVRASWPSPVKFEVILASVPYVLSERRQVAESANKPKRGRPRKSACQMEL